MKNKQKRKNLTFGELIMGAYKIWGKGRAEKMLRLAINAKLVVFRGRQVLITS
jgi:hypothetical protein